MIRQFFYWWFRQLRGLFPFASGNEGGQWLDVTVDAARVRAALSDRRESVLMDVAREQESALQTELGRIAASLDQTQVRCRVWVDAREVLGRAIELPIAAEENLREVLSFEMARKTPFRAQDVYFDALITQRDPARHEFSVQLNVVPRRALEVVTSVLETWDLQAIPSASAARIAQSNKQAVFAFQGSAYLRRTHTGLNLVLAVASVALAAICVWLPINSQQQTLEQLDAQEQRARIEASRAMALRGEFDALQSAGIFLADARSAHPAMVQIIDELTRALPDNTFLSRLQVDGGAVNLHGSSQAASELIAILERLPMLEGVRFASPVTRDAATAGERFHIVARLVTRIGGKNSGEENVSDSSVVGFQSAGFSGRRADLLPTWAGSFPLSGSSEQAHFIFLCSAGDGHEVSSCRSAAAVHGPHVRPLSETS